MKQQQNYDEYEYLQLYYCLHVSSMGSETRNCDGFLEEIGYIHLEVEKTGIKMENKNVWK